MVPEKKVQLKFKNLLMRKIALLILPLLIIYFKGDDSFQRQILTDKTECSLQTGTAPIEAKQGCEVY